MHIDMLHSLYMNSFVVGRLEKGVYTSLGQEGHRYLENHIVSDLDMDYLDNLVAYA